MSRTPEPQARGEIRTPDAPRYGAFYDTYEPFAPRKSARVAERLERAETPPPKSFINNRNLDDSPDPFTSTPKKSASPQRMAKFYPPTPTGHASRSSFFGDEVSEEIKDTLMSGTGSTARPSMLPTPAKTPTSKSSIENAAISSVSRTLFSAPTPRRSVIDKAMPRKKGRKNVSLFDITSDGEEPIKIFTDSKERIPEIDPSSENEFYRTANSGANSGVQKLAGQGKKRKTASASSSAAQHSFAPDTKGVPGAVYNFRGKKLWLADRPKSSGGDADAQAEGEAQPFRLEPRFLFGVHPREKAKAENDVTDAEEEEEPYHKPAGEKQAPRTFSASKIPVPKVVRPVTPMVVRPVTPTRAAVTPPPRFTRSQKAKHAGATDKSEETLMTPEDEGRGRGRTRSTSPAAYDHWHRARARVNMDDLAERGSPTQGPTTRSRRAARARLAQPLFL